jgi:hypothetical protein
METTMKEGTDQQDTTRMKTLELFDPWAAAYAMATGVQLLKVLTGHPIRYVFDDTDGAASRALGEWRTDAALVRARALASAFRQIRRLARG